MYRDGRAVAAFMHLHTPYSSRAERDVRGVEVINHHVAPRDIIDTAPAGVDLLFGPSDHVRSSPDLYDDLDGWLADRDGHLDVFDTHAYGELDDTRFAFWNGIEATVDGNDAHFGVYGIPPREEVTLYDLPDVDALYDEAKAAGADLVVANHPHLPLFGTPDEHWKGFLDASRSTDIASGVEYSTGYNDIGNLVSRGLFADEPVTETARGNGLYLVPGLDAHDTLPPRYEGVGVLPGHHMDGLASPGVDTDVMLDDMQVAGYTPWTAEGLGTGIPPLKTVRGGLEFLRTYADVLPAWNTRNAVDRAYHALDFPHTVDDHADRWDATVATVEPPTRQELIDAAYDPLDD